MDKPSEGFFPSPPYFGSGEPGFPTSPYFCVRRVGSILPSFWLRSRHAPATTHAVLALGARPRPDPSTSAIRPKPVLPIPLLISVRRGSPPQNAPGISSSQEPARPRRQLAPGDSSSQEPAHPRSRQTHRAGFTSSNFQSPPVWHQARWFSNPPLFFVRRHFSIPPLFWFRRARFSNPPLFSCSKVFFHPSHISIPGTLICHA